MSVIIRLQNLPWSANALDIRQFFGGLSIPEGGVHIVGGELGDAFIAFSTDEDARQAFQRNNGKIKSVQITLTLSSRTEMQRVIEAARTQSYSVFLQANTQTNNVPMPAAIPPLSSSSLMFDKFQQDKKERERKRSRSRERRDRSRDRKDRRRDRSRSRSRDRRKRRERSRSRDRSKSRERRSRDSSRRRSSERTTQPKKIEPWASQQQSQNDLPQLLATNLEELKRNLMNQAALSGNGFDVLNFAKRESWPPSINLSRNQFDQRNDDRRGFQRNDYDPRLSPNCCVKVEPFYGSYGDLRRFFQGCFISSRGIKFINDTSGTRTGIVFVQFGNPQSKVEALSRNNENFGGVSLSIIHIDDKDFENAVDRFIPKSNNDRDDLRQFKDDEIKIFTCLTVEDLPTYVKEQDILKMFSHYPLIGIIIPPKGRGNHVAYVKFSNPDDAKKALSETSIHSIEGKSVTVKPCKDEDFNKINDEHDVKINVRKNNETDCINITGLPFKTTDKDIIDFFSDIGIIPTKVHLISNNFGFTGQAYCEFEKYDDCEKALIKNSSKLGLNLITVEAVTRKEMEKYVNKDEVDDEVEEVPIQQNQIIKQNGLLPQPFLNNQQRFFNQRNNFRGRGGGNNNGNGRGGNNRFGGQNNIRQQNFNTNEDMVPPGCTVFMDNIPYKAGTNEILDFFNGYNVTNNVSRRFNPNNTPSAEAKVVFNNAEDAFIAVRDRHLKTIWDRPIYLRQV